MFFNYSVYSRYPAYVTCKIASNPFQSENLTFSKNISKNTMQSKKKKLSKVFFWIFLITLEDVLLNKYKGYI